MLERLRQVAFMVRDLEEGRELYRQTLDMEPCHSEDLSQYGLRNLVFPAGNGTFVELLQPVSTDTPSERFLERRGEAPYLLVFETKQYDRLISRLKSLAVDVTDETQDGQQRSAFIHPSSVNGTFLQVIEVSGGDNPWPAAGGAWLQGGRTPLTKQLRQVAVLVRDLDHAVGRLGRAIRPEGYRPVPGQLHRLGNRGDSPGGTRHLYRTGPTNQSRLPFRAVFGTARRGHISDHLPDR